MLSDAKIRQKKPSNKSYPYKLYDEKGLFLLVSESKAKKKKKKAIHKWWRFRYRFGGKPKEISLGTYPKVSLKEAREARDEAIELLDKDIDPSQHRREQKRAEQASADTFKAISEEWLEAGCPGKKRSKGRPSDETIRQLRQRLKKYVYPRIGHKPMRKITLDDMEGVVDPISMRGKHETAHRIRSLCERIYGYAIAKRLADRNLAADLAFTIAPVPKSSGFAAILDPKEFGHLLNAIDTYEGQPATMAALKLAPLVFVRPIELRAAEWAEIDLKAKKWSIPEGRMKEGQPHTVPLSKQAVKILKDIHKVTGRGKYVFPGLRSASRPISDNTLNAAMRRLGYSKEQHTAHGFRKSAATMLAELGYDREWIETALAHKRPGVEGIYNKSHLYEQRKKMLQEWADYLDGLKKEAIESA